VTLLDRQRATQTVKALSQATPVMLLVLLVAFTRQVYSPETGKPDPLLCFVVFGLVLWGIAGLAGKPRPVQRRKAGWLLVSCLLIAAVWLLPWTPRQVFFHQVGQVRPGMSVADVEKRLGHYHVVLSRQFNGSGGPSARPVAPGFSGGMVYLRDVGDPHYRDYASIGFTSGRVESTTQIAD
jgi:hypothetical protein